MEGWILEIVGYVASILVAISLMMQSILRLRLINLIGSAAFTLYGVLIEAYPVAVVNLFIVFINLYYLRGMLRPAREYFRLLEVKPESDYVRAFVEFYAEDIRHFLPRFVHTPTESQFSLFVLRDLVPAGLLLGKVHGQTLQVELDFVMPKYRDFKIGHYLYHEQADYFRARGITEIVTPAGTAEHRAYLEKMGFIPANTASKEPGTYRLPLGE